MKILDLDDYPDVQDVLDDAARWVILDQACEGFLPLIPDESIDAIVTDPPAGIEFMGAEVDTYRARAPNPSGKQTAAWDESGGAGGTRPFARQATPRFTGKAGTRDLAMRASFIKHITAVMIECLRVLKPGGHALVWAIPRTAHWTATAIEDAGFEIRDVVLHLFGTGFPKSVNAGKGWGTALKPAAEHWILARKPLDGTVVANVLAHGTGALNIDGCRIGTEAVEARAVGRWPANVTLDDEAAVMLDAQNDESGASRFFYVAKATKKEKTTDGKVENKHPTVKSISLMEWLVRLITPPGGIVLDPFAGSGSTGVAALQGNFRFIGIERESEYAAVATKRLELSALEVMAAKDAPTTQLTKADNL